MSAPRACLALVVLLAACGGTTIVGHRDLPATIPWHDLSENAFGRAAADHRLVLLSIQAGWCHWCHVMNAQTFADEQVRTVIDESYFPVRAEADERPDLADRWRDYGWPATVILASDGTPIVALRGYQAPAPFAALLVELATELHANRLRPRVAAPAPAHPSDDALAAIRMRVEAQLAATWDEREAGWGVPQKYPFGAPVRYALARSEAGVHAPWDAEARRSLDAYAHLVDPVWGGMYQYSVDGDWAHPHYEKIASVQADALRTFAASYARTHERRDLDTAQAVARFVTSDLFMGPRGFYASMDADLRREGAPMLEGAPYYALDDEARRALGLPRRDDHVYADVNGDLATGLVALADASGDDALLATGTRAVDAILTTHGRPEGDVRHAAPSVDALYLRDQVQLLRAELALFAATGARAWRDRAVGLATFVRGAFGTDVGAFAARTTDERAVGVLATPQTPFVENALLAEAFVRLAVLTGDASWRELATRIVRALGDPEVLSSQGRIVGEYLLALDALLVPRVHVTVVGDAHDARTVALHRAARALGSSRTVVERADPGATDYGSPAEPCAFLCTETTCSSPITDPVRLAETLGSLPAS